MKIYLITIVAFVLGVILTTLGYAAYTVYQLRATVAEDHATIVQVVDFLNSQIQAANGKSSSMNPSSQVVPQTAPQKK